MSFSILARYLQVLVVLHTLPYLGQIIRRSPTLTHPGICLCTADSSLNVQDTARLKKGFTARNKINLL